TTSSLRFEWTHREDPRNVNGGAWSFRVNKKQTAEVWRELLMLLIGEQFEEFVSVDDDIFGLTVSSRYNSDIFTIWNKNANVHEESNVLGQLSMILKPIELQLPYYKAHREHAAFKKTNSSRNGK
ncbi:3035_t:CDS:2, partial [Ambispora leptoticha]